MLDWWSVKIWLRYCFRIYLSISFVSKQDFFIRYTFFFNSFIVLKLSDQSIIIWLSDIDNYDRRWSIKRIAKNYKGESFFNSPTFFKDLKCKHSKCVKQCFWQHTKTQRFHSKFLILKLPRLPNRPRWRYKSSRSCQIVSIFGVLGLFRSRKNILWRENEISFHANLI